jgi:hypothetical protein
VSQWLFVGTPATIARRATRTPRAIRTLPARSRSSLRRYGISITSSRWAAPDSQRRSTARGHTLLDIAGLNHPGLPRTRVSPAAAATEAPLALVPQS